MPCDARKFEYIPKLFIRDATPQQWAHDLGRINRGLKVTPFGHKEPPVPAIAEKQDAQAVQQGASLYIQNCFFCHGANVLAGSLPDLRYSSKSVLDSLRSIVLDGTRAAYGMPSFHQKLTAENVNAIRAYIISRAQESAKPSQPALRGDR